MAKNLVFQTLELTAARFFEAERATYFVSGYLGNAILVQGLIGDYEHIFIDEDSHFSVWHAVQAAGIPATSFRHLAAEDLDLQCRAKLGPGERPLVISDGVFSHLGRNSAGAGLRGRVGCL